MSKKRIRLAMSAAALACLACLFAGCGKTPDWVMRVDGSEVYEEEFSLLLKENTLKYERELRQEYGIAEDQPVKDYLEEHNENYRRLLFQKNAAFTARTRAEQSMAQEYDLASEFTYEALLDRMEEENRLRQEKLERGEPVYGLQSFTPRQYYSYYMSEVRKRLLETIPDAALEVTEADALRYYRELDGFSQVEGETLCFSFCETAQTDVPSATGESQWETLKLTAVEARELFGKGEAGERLLNLPAGAVEGPVLLNGKPCLIRYDGFEKAETLTESELQTFMERVREQALEHLLYEKAERAQIQINPSYEARYVHEGGLP